MRVEYNRFSTVVAIRSMMHDLYDIFSFIILLGYADGMKSGMGFRDNHPSQEKINKTIDL